MKRVRIYPYHFRVSAAREIVDYLIDAGVNALRVYPDKNYRPKADDIVINWGCSSAPKWKNPLNVKFNLVNPWENIHNAVNKVKTFAIMRAKGVSCPDATVDHAEAKRWIAQGNLVVGRKKITGMGGEGIILISTLEEWQPCQLYTKYKPKKKEFRIHVFNGKVLDFQEKRKKRGVENVNTKIRTHNNGYVFCRDGAVLPNGAGELAIKAVDSLGLAFGGVDLIWNQKENQCYILEVNSAPGIEGTTVSKYAEEILSMAQGN